MYKLSTYFFPLKVDFFLFYLQAQTIKETIRGKNGELQGTAVTTVRGNKSVTVYKDKYGKITGRSESTTNSQGKTNTVYRNQYGQRTGTSTTSIKILERLLLQLRSIVINTGSVRVQVPLGKLAIPPLQPIRISMEESRSEETVRGSSFHA